MSHSCPNLVSTSFLYNPYIPFLICRNFLFTIYVEKLSFPNLLYFLSYMDTCIAIIMYCQRLFLLFTCKQHCLHNFFFFGGPTCDEYLS